MRVDGCRKCKNPSYSVDRVNEMCGIIKRTDFGDLDDCVRTTFGRAGSAGGRGTSSRGSEEGAEGERLKWRDVRKTTGIVQK